METGSHFQLFALVNEIFSLYTKNWFLIFILNNIFPKHDFVSFTVYTETTRSEAHLKIFRPNIKMSNNLEGPQQINK